MKKELQDLKKCQTSKGYNSCFRCDKLLKCNIRSEYVKAVYKSMNIDYTDSKKGFEF